MKKSAPVGIDWKPDKNSSVPVYMQIVQFMREKVSRGDWPIGTRLPAQRVLAKQFGVNRSTITTAIDELSAYGVLEGSHGAGTRIVSNTWSLLLSPAPNWDEYISSGFFKANNATIQTINRAEFMQGIIRLGTGEPDVRLFPQEMWRQALQKLSDSVTSLGYLEPLGLPALRRQIAAHMQRLGVHATPDSVLVTSGSLQALQLISACLLKKGATVYTEAPSYLKSLQIFQSAGMRLSGVPMGEDGMRFEALAPALAAPGTQDPSIIYTIPTNHNPTGITMPNERRAAFIEFCGENRLPIIEDGTYQELCFEGAPPTALKAMDKMGMVLYLGSLSKAFAPGLRIGWVVAPEPIVQRLGDVKMQTDYGASSVSQLLAAELLESGMYGRYVQTLKAELLRRRNSALAVLEKHFGDFAVWRKPSGGFYIWTTITQNVKIERLFEAALEAGILLNPGDIYDFEHNHALRLSYAYTTCEEFEAAAVRLAAIIRQLAKQP